MISINSDFYKNAPPTMQKINKKLNVFTFNLEIHMLQTLKCVNKHINTE